MPPLTPAALRKQIAAETLSPLYALVGADDAEKSAVAAEIADSLDEGLRAFNFDKLYGGDINADELIQAAATLPMMAPRRVVVVLEAEKLLAPRRETKAAEADQERLEEFLRRPPPHATVVFVCGALDMRRRAVKLLLKDAFVVDCGSLADERDAEQWVAVRAAREKVAFEPAAVRALAQRAGPDLVRLRAGFDRVVLYAYGRPAVTVDDVQVAVPAGPEAQAEFGVAKAIWRNDARVALRELGLAFEAGAVPVMLMGQLRAAAEKLPSRRVRAAMDAVLRTDLALKSSGGDARVLLERLVVELCEGSGTASQDPRTLLRRFRQ